MHAGLKPIIKTKVCDLNVTYGSTEMQRCVREHETYLLRFIDTSATIGPVDVTQSFRQYIIDSCIGLDRCTALVVQPGCGFARAGTALVGAFSDAAP